MTTYSIELFDGSQHPALHPTKSASASTEREARRIAAGMLGHKTLRGAASWERYQGGTVFQFGPRCEDNEFDYVVLTEEEPASYAIHSDLLGPEYLGTQRDLQWLADHLTEVGYQCHLGHQNRGRRDDVPEVPEDVWLAALDAFVEEHPELFK